MTDKIASGARERLDLASASEVDPQRLRDFYAEMFPGRTILDRWQWLYRASDRSPFPLVLLDGGRIAAHAGGIPFAARLDGREHRAAWFVDFAVRPDRQRHGLGQRLTDAWMQHAELCFTFCNEKSMGVFRRFGWQERFDWMLHTIWIRPFDQPRARASMHRAVRGVANAAVRPCFTAWCRWHGGAEPDLRPLDLDWIRRAFDAECAANAAVACTLRDADYVSWRLGASPVRDAYRLYRDDGVTMIVKLEGAARPSVDVLWMSPESADAPDRVRAMIASLVLWAARRGRACVRYWPIDPRVTAACRVLGARTSRPRFAFWSADARLRDRVRAADWRWQLIDSDYEWI